MPRGALVAACALVASCANVECSFNSDCGDRARCEMNRCVRDCVQDRDCLAGEACSVNGACVPRKTVDRPPVDDAADVDAGLDAPDDLGFDAPSEAPPRPDADPPRDVVTPPPDVAPPPDLVTPLDNPPPPDVAPPPDVSPPPDIAPPDIAAPPDVARDVAPPDAPVGPVGVGVYEYTGVRPGALAAPVAVAWHPSGGYALVLSASDTVFRYDPAAMAVTQAATTSRDVAWRAVSFTPDGARALLVGTTTSTSGGTTTRRGRMFVWDHATATLAERATEAWTMGEYLAIRWAPNGTRAALLGRATSFLSIWFYGPDGVRNGGPIAYGRVANTGCDDLAWVRDGFGDPALAVVCGYNTGEILSVTDPLGTPRFATAAGSGAVGNTTHIASRPQGDLALAIGASSSRLYRYRDARWDVGFSSPMLRGASGVAFSFDGARALVYGGFGYVHEYRYDLYSAADIVDVSITNLGAAPFAQPTNANLRALAWRPGCDEGVAVGGASSVSGTTAFVAAFRVMGGRRCP